mmetsp:Transcript_7770/g.16973  ORF Transcript_7770/g.16973 Transcript_7770/m.16973 type:complete len:465 (-) Transcript_7770:14-1408(-)
MASSLRGEDDERRGRTRASEQEQLRQRYRGPGTDRLRRRSRSRSRSRRRRSRSRSRSRERRFGRDAIPAIVSDADFSKARALATGVARSPVAAAPPSDSIIAPTPAPVDHNKSRPPSLLSLLLRGSAAGATLDTPAGGGTSKDTSEVASGPTVGQTSATTPEPAPVASPLAETSYHPSSAQTTAASSSNATSFSVPAAPRQDVDASTQHRGHEATKGSLATSKDRERARRRRRAVSVSSGRDEAKTSKASMFASSCSTHAQVRRGGTSRRVTNEASRPMRHAQERTRATRATTVERKQPTTRKKSRSPSSSSSSSLLQRLIKQHREKRQERLKQQGAPPSRKAVPPSEAEVPENSAKDEDAGKKPRSSKRNKGGERIMTPSMGNSLTDPAPRPRSRRREVPSAKEGSSPGRVETRHRQTGKDHHLRNRGNGCSKRFPSKSPPKKEVSNSELQAKQMGSSVLVVS